MTVRDAEGSAITFHRTLAVLASVLAGISAVALLAIRLNPAAAGALTLAATVAGALLLQRRPIDVYPAAGKEADPNAVLDRRAEQLQHVRWFVHMRWIAIVVSYGLILIGVPVGRLLPLAALPFLLGWWLLLVVANLGFHRWSKSGTNFERQILVQGGLDLVVLTGFLNGSGGVENPLYFAYLFHVIIAAVLLPPRKAFGLTWIAAMLFVLMAMGEYFHVLPHFTNDLFPHSEGAVGGHEHAAREAGGHNHAGTSVAHAAHGAMFVLGRTLPFLVLLLFSSYLTSLIAGRLRRRESELEATGATLMLEHQKLERVVESTGVGMMLVDPGLGIPWASRRAAGWLQIEGLQVERCPLYQTEGGCQECIAEETLATGGAREQERSFRSGSGGVRYLRHATSPVVGADGGAIQVVELLEDVTDRKALEAEAVHSGKLSALGQMAAGVAHEIGNPLSSLSTRLSLLERRPEPEFVAESVTLLRGQIERIRRIVRGISLFARSGKQEWATWSLNQLVRDGLEIARLDRRGKRVKFVTGLADPDPVARGVKDQMSQVLLNLLLNACEASRDGAEVKVETEQDDAWARLRVTDEGSGITAEDRKRLFEPFFSTKSKGTGLGLSISYSLVAAHGGKIEVDSEEGVGSTFTVSLPRAPASGADGLERSA